MLHRHLAGLVREQVIADGVGAHDRAIGRLLQLDDDLVLARLLAALVHVVDLEEVVHLRGLFFLGGGVVLCHIHSSRSLKTPRGSFRCPGGTSLRPISAFGFFDYDCVMIGVPVCISMYGRKAYSSAVSAPADMVQVTLSLGAM